MLWAIIVILIVAVDQITKQIVMTKIPYGEIVPVIDKFFYLTYHENKGAAWGIFQNGRIFFIVLTLLISSVMIYFISKSKPRMLKLALAIILGGALGNFIDRVVKGGVGDFLDFYIGSYHFPTFNAADTFIVIGTILLAVYLLFIYKEPAKAEKTTEDSGTAVVAEKAAEPEDDKIKDTKDIENKENNEKK